MLVEIITFFFSPILTIFDPILSWLTDAFTSQKTQRAAVKSIIIGIVTLVLLAIAFFAYLGFYMLYVPKIAHVKEIYLQYDKGQNLISEVDFTEGGQYRRILTSDQAYDVSIDLDVPASETNIKLGNFMVGLELWSDVLNDTVAKSNRPCILMYQSRLLRISSTVWRLVPLILGFSKEYQVLKIPMLENIVERSDAPITKAFISISNKYLNTYNAKIRLDAHFTGLRYFMYYYPTSATMSFVLLFLTWEIFSSIIAWKAIVSQWPDNTPEASDTTIPKRISAGLGSEGSGQGSTGLNLGDDNRVRPRQNDAIEGSEIDRGLTTEQESEYESSQPGGMISPNIETVDHSDSPTDSDAHSAADESATENDDEEEQEENNTPTQSRRSTVSDVSELTSGDSGNEEGSIIGASTSRSSVGNTRAYRRNGSGVGATGESYDDQ
ncbi:14038_t:CDS:2 [Acaulospora morrowiae]|uniref:14038_t:CDS:1 n=1 Tax=Acaulospora morrowiae TaxID=94023 RepID=A0A9N8V3X7_9GLOM|nr:14038_t:CDS:2 [Acaulospora morrowiae]